MTNISLEELGITEENLTDKLVDKLSDKLLQSLHYDEDGDEWFGQSDMSRKITKAIQDRIDDKVAKIAELHVLPNVDALIEGVKLQKTNEWGEVRGQSVTFIEYMVKRADEYLIEVVDINGKTKSESGSSFFSKSGRRVDYMIDKHLKYSIEKAMKEALKTANDSIVGGLEKAVKDKLAELKVMLDVKVGK